MRKDIESLYHALELKPGASPDEISRAYRALMKQWHPDRFRAGSLMQKTAEDRTKEINEAYDQLFKKKLYKQYRPSRPPETRAAAAAYRQSTASRQGPIETAGVRSRPRNQSRPPHPTPPPKPSPPPPRPKPTPQPPPKPKPPPPRRPPEMRQPMTPPRPSIKRSAPAKPWRHYLKQQPWRRLALGLLVVAGIGLVLTNIHWPDIHASLPEPSQVISPSPLAIINPPHANPIVVVAPPARTPASPDPQSNLPPAPPVSVVLPLRNAFVPDWGEPVPATTSLAAASACFATATVYFTDAPLPTALRDNLSAWYRPGRSELDRLIVELDTFIDVFEPGDPPSRVLLVQGLPDEATPTTWRYGSSLVCFKDGHVDHWSDGFPRLRIHVREEIPFTDWSAVLGR